MLFAPCVRFRVFGWVCVAGGCLLGNSCSLGLLCACLVWVPDFFFFFFFVAGRLMGNSCSLGLRCVFLVWVPDFFLIFFFLGFWSVFFFTSVSGNFSLGFWSVFFTSVSGVGISLPTFSYL